MSASAPLVVDVARGRSTDGPGIRSVVFFKGCPLRCTFCHNPETHRTWRELAWYPHRCVACGDGASVCPHRAIAVDDGGVCTALDRARCDGCGKCAERCAGQALRSIGTAYRPEELGELLLRDRAFYRHSGGGVTLSGGECTLYPDYLRAVLLLLKCHSVHVVLQTCGWFDYDVVRRLVLPLVDEVHFDLKPIDPERHLATTGRSNGPILANLARLVADAEVVVRPRITLVPGVTATDSNLRAAADLLCRLGVGDVTLLPYDPLGTDLQQALGHPLSDRPDHFMSMVEEQGLRERFVRLVDDCRTRAKSNATPEGGEEWSRSMSLPALQ